MQLELGAIQDADIRRALEQLSLMLGPIVDRVSFGAGVPTFTPANSARMLYLRSDGGGGTTLYVWEGAAWVGK